MINKIFYKLNIILLLFVLINSKSFAEQFNFDVKEILILNNVILLRD